MTSRVWKLPDLWTHRTRPRAPWKTHRTRFPQLPHASTICYPCLRTNLLPMSPAVHSATLGPGRRTKNGPRTKAQEPRTLQYAKSKTALSLERFPLRRSNSISAMARVVRAFVGCEQANSCRDQGADLIKGPG